MRKSQSNRYWNQKKEKKKELTGKYECNYVDVSIYVSIYKYWCECGWEYLIVDMRSKHECKHQGEYTCKCMFKHICQDVVYVGIYVKIHDVGI